MPEYRYILKKPEDIRPSDVRLDEGQWGIPEGKLRDILSRTEGGEKYKHTDSAFKTALRQRKLNIVEIKSGSKPAQHSPSSKLTGGGGGSGGGHPAASNDAQPGIEATASDQVTLVSMKKDLNAGGGGAAKPNEAPTVRGQEGIGTVASTPSSMSSTQSPSFDLDVNEKSEGKEGGHLLKSHVEWTEEDLLGRLQEDQKKKTVSSFNTRSEAEAAVKVALTFGDNPTQIENWKLSGAPGKFAIEAPFSGGSVLKRNAPGIVQGKGVRIILKKSNTGDYYILTGYPIL
jgi:hypothetical protein